MSMSYPLFIDSLRFAGMLSSWATQNDIPHDHSVQNVKHNRSTKTPPPRPVIFTFESAADRATLLFIARTKIAELRNAQPRHGGGGRGAGIPHSTGFDAIVASLEQAYRGIS
jgi:hypothetical protein